MKKINPDILRLNDILQAIDDIENIGLTSSGSRTDLLATAYAVAIIGEATNRLSIQIKEKHKDTPWQDIVGMRNRIIHEYGKIDSDLLIEVVNQHIPVLKQQVQGILGTIKG